jgi:hypothetical protein
LAISRGPRQIIKAKNLIEFLEIWLVVEEAKTLSEVIKTTSFV